MSLFLIDVSHAYKGVLRNYYFHHFQPQQLLLQIR